MKRALITGITGQDGSYLAEFLLRKGYEVHGIKRRASSFNTARIDHLYQDPHDPDIRFRLHYGDLTDANSLIRILQAVQPDEIYNLGAQSHVAVSFESPEYTANVDALGTLRILDAVHTLSMTHKTRFYQASSSELYGLVHETPQKETTPFHPRSPYGVSKLFAYWITVNYREAYGMYACNGILFNHESPERGETFVTRKITRGLARVKVGLQECVFLGNLDAKRDWGHARDYVEMQWLMLQQDEPDDYVIATGRQYSVREFVNVAAEMLDLKLTWRGSRPFSPAATAITVRSRLYARRWAQISLRTISGALHRRTSICIVALIERISTSPSHLRSYRSPICPPSTDASRIVVTTLNRSARLSLSRASTVTWRMSRTFG